MNLLELDFHHLNIFKAYYIVWAFMHMEGEKSSLRWAVVAPVIFLSIVLIIHLIG
jgi:cytochrome c oxidase subunit 4